MKFSTIIAPFIIFFLPLVAMKCNKPNTEKKNAGIIHISDGSHSKFAPSVTKCENRLDNIRRTFSVCHWKKKLRIFPCILIVRINCERICYSRNMPFKLLFFHLVCSLVIFSPCSFFFRKPSYIHQWEIITRQNGWLWKRIEIVFFWCIWSIRFTLTFSLRL